MAENDENTEISKAIAVIYDHAKQNDHLFDKAIILDCKNSDTKYYMQISRDCKYDLMERNEELRLENIELKQKLAEINNLSNLNRI